MHWVGIPESSLALVAGAEAAGGDGLDMTVDSRETEGKRVEGKGKGVFQRQETVDSYDMSKSLRSSRRAKSRKWSRYCFDGTLGYGMCR